MLEEYKRLVSEFQKTRDNRVIGKILQLFDVNLGKDSTQRQIEVLLGTDSFVILDSEKNTKCYVYVFDENYSVTWQKNGFKYVEVYDYNHKRPNEYVYQLENDKDEMIICKRNVDKEYINNSIMKFVNHNKEKILVYEKIYSTPPKGEKSIETMTNTYDLNTYRSINVLREHDSYLLEDEILSKKHGYIINSVFADKVPSMWTNVDMGEIPNFVLADGLATLFIEVLNANKELAVTMVSLKKADEIIEVKLYQNEQHVKTFHAISDTKNQISIDDLDEVAKELEDMDFIKKGIVMLIYKQIRDMYANRNNKDNEIENFFDKYERTKFEKMANLFAKDPELFEDCIYKDIYINSKGLVKNIRKN